MKIFPKIASDFWMGVTESAPKKYFPKIFLREIGGGSKHVLGNFPYCEGVKYFRKKISPLDLGNFFKKKIAHGHINDGRQKYYFSEIRHRGQISGHKGQRLTST